MRKKSALSELRLNFYGTIVENIRNFTLYDFSIIFAFRFLFDSFVIVSSDGTKSGLNMFLSELE